jgi:NADH-quinone oxidoreductase subunit C
LNIDELFVNIQQCFGSKAKYLLEQNQITLEVSASELRNICLKLRDNSQFMFEQLMDLCAVDYLKYGVGEWETNSATAQGFSRAVNVNASVSTLPRFAVVYHLLSVARNQRLRIRVFLDANNLRIPSVIDIWNSADWYEREAFDLFGILFEGHPDLRRILTDYGFIGHPFRKDFPLIGQVEMRYDAGEGRVIYEPVSIEPRTLVPKVVRYTGAVEEKVNG